ncbi:hypothetical protein N9B82_06815 [Saprospiraceae bacterium]|nr:hypothetical protein [Saprospiraceae bacterium]
MSQLTKEEEEEEEEEEEDIVPMKASNTLLDAPIVRAQLNFSIDKRP